MLTFINIYQVYIIYSLNLYSLTQIINNITFICCLIYNSEEMKKLLCEDGVNIILDRYTYSGVAYSAAKGISVDWCMKPEQGLIKPDIVLYLDLEVKTALERITDGTNERYETKSFLEKVKSVYDDKLFDDSFWTKVDASQKIGEVTAELYDNIITVIDKCKETPLNYI